MSSAFCPRPNRSLLLLPVLVSFGCAKNRDPAPEDMDGIVRWLFRNYDDPEVFEEGLENLAPWLDGDARSEEAQEGLVLSDMAVEDVAAVDRPDDDLTEMIGVAVPGVSPWPILAHAELLTRADQTWNDTTYDVYTREIVEGDVDAFLAGSGRIRTVNDIDKSGGFGVHIPYTLYKDYQWGALPDGSTGVVSRSWTAEPACAEGGENCLWQSFSVDLFYAPDPSANETIRMTASWNELETTADAFLSDDARIGLMALGIQDIFENTDELLAEEAQ